MLGRCRATNLCRYCQTLYVVETVEMLTLDAVEWPPTIWVVLTAREHLTRAECRDHLRQLRRLVRKQWPRCEWFVQVEFQRRGALHLNLLVKGVPVEDLVPFGDRFARLWCSRVDAERVAQWFGPVSDAGGAVRYLSKMLAHGLKREQAPPIGWKGHRTSQTRGYLVRPASVMRVEARRALRVKRRIWRGMDAPTAELEVAAAESDTWSLRYVKPSSLEFGRVLAAPRHRASAAGRESAGAAPGSGESPLPRAEGRAPGRLRARESWRGSRGLGESQVRHGSPGAGL